MHKLLKDPLVHFLLIGAALFALSAWHGQAVRIGRERIVVTGEQVAQARSAAALLQGREPTAEELAQYVEPIVRDEVLYREALALRLDENDDEVRRRLIEKMRYLTEDLADPESPSADALRAFYAESPELFTTPELVTFDQVFVSPSEHGADAEAAAEKILDELRAGAAPEGIGDRTPLRGSYEDAPRDQVEVLFGKALAEALFSMTPGEWTGPYMSDFGLHLVRLESRTPERLPPYDEIAARVADEFAATRRRQANEAAYQEMRSHYEVIIEPPMDTVSEPAQTDSP